MEVGNASTLEFSAGSELINAVCAEAGRATNESAKSPDANRRLDTFIITVYPR
jgi:hypothetical protein